MAEAAAKLDVGAMKEMLAALSPLLKDIALTPEKLQEALKPYVDPKILAREKREREASRAQFLADMEITKARQEACPHKDKNEKWAINVVHNFPDHQPRGTCPLCAVWIHPDQWVIPGAGFDGGNGLGKPYIVKAHPLYHVVRFLESQA